ncbi:uncharacterized protein ARMOST_22485 [Armillaria ostoyae]|uniref:Uncharacterized protein n=1 Tax=Armillaria ostoyae TaxID=47428 RepID=A0A284SD19_ARMOS|nr:uncharacterized protein ARMOST_22485 [Armillaria ostoyae]
MASAIATKLGVAWDPDITIHMQSANGQLEKTLGLARNVPFLFNDITVYLQVHIIASPAYKVLLGRPFDVLTESVIRNQADGGQIITITDLNTSRRCTIPTFLRGGPPRVAKAAPKATEEGELALQIVQTSDGNFEIEGYMQPKEGASFSEKELRDSFLMASMTSEENLLRDEQAHGLLNSYFQGKIVPEGYKMQYHVCEHTSDGSPLLDDNEIPVYNVLVDNLHAKPTTSKPKKKKTTLVPGFEHLGARMTSPDFKPVAVLASKKYKPVALKVKPLLGDLPDKFRIVRDIKGDPLKDIPLLSTSPPEYVPAGCYTQERKAKIDENHPEGFLWPEERKLMHHFMTIQEQAFAWDDTESGHFREDFFPPIDIPIVPHTPWVLKNIPIPPGIYEEVCRIIKSKIDAGVYEPSNSSYLWNR